MKVINLIIILVILFIIFSNVTEGFILTNNIPSGLSITLSKGAQPVTSTVGTGFTTDGTTLDANTYYAIGNLNDAGKKSVNDANALVKNNGTTCAQFPSSLYIKLPTTDAVCKTTDVDLYDVPADSFSTCTKNINGVLYKSGKLKTPDSAITIQDGYNGGKTCTQILPATKDIVCGGIDAVCKTADVDLYDVPADSNAVCTILENGVWKKQGTLKTDTSITITAKFGNGKTCAQQLPATKNVNCGPINAVCPINDNTFYSFNKNIVKGSALIVPPAPTIASITSSLSTETFPGAFTATIKVTPPASYATLGITNYSVSIMDKTTNQKVNIEDTATIDSAGNLKLLVNHERPTDYTKYQSYGQNFRAIRSAMAYDQYWFDASYNVTIAGINSAGITGPRSAVFSFNSGFPNSEAMTRVTSDDFGGV